MANKTVVQALVAERATEVAALAAAQADLIAASASESAATTSAAAFETQLASADGAIAAARLALETADPVDVPAITTVLRTAEEARTDARAGLLGQQEHVRAAAVSKAVAAQQVTRGQARLAEIDAMAAAATLEVVQQALLGTRVAAARGAATAALLATAQASVTAAFTVLQNNVLRPQLYDAMRKRRELVNLRLDNAHALDEAARSTAELMAPTRVGISSALEAAQGDYERRRADATTFAGQAAAQLAQVSAFLAQPAPVASVAALADLLARSQAIDNKKAVVDEIAFLEKEIILETKRQALELKLLQKVVTPTVSVTAARTAHDAALTTRNALLVATLAPRLELMRVWRTAIPEEIKTYLARLEDVAAVLARLQKGFTDDLASVALDADLALGAAIIAAGDTRRRAELADDARLGASRRLTDAEQSFGVLGLAASWGESSNPVALVW